MQTPETAVTRTVKQSKESRMPIEKVKVKEKDFIKLLAPYSTVFTFYPTNEAGRRKAAGILAKLCRNSAAQRKYLHTPVMQVSVTGSPAVLWRAAAASSHQRDAT